MPWVIKLITVLIAVQHAYAQSIPQDRAVLENSEGAGMAAYAEFNHYPGPKHVLELGEKIELSEEQEKDIESIIEEMAEKARATGESIIAREIELEQAFRSGKADRNSILILSRTIGTLRGELRAIHLAAHLQARDILTKEQIATYYILRPVNRLSGKQ
jgi:Spy/CpxP family protein refolding chaperone